VPVRTATVNDAYAVESVRIRGWQAAYRDIVPDDYLDALVVDERRRAERILEPGIMTLIADVDGRAAGMAVFGPSREGSGEVELYALYVDPDHWRRGVGTALLTACEGVTVLWVLKDNARAQAFYQRHGFAADGGSQVLDLGAPVVEIRMRRG
jgi:ribosomal protein S18 acetylase RimI-like enzyme